MKTKLKSILALALCAVGLSAFAKAEPVTYLDWDDVNKKPTNAVCTAYEVVTADTATFAAGTTYVVQGTVEQSVHGIAVEGTSSEPTRLILCDGAKLTVTGQSAAETAGLNVSNGMAIVICGQKSGTGVLEAIGGGGAAGVGGNSGQTGGTVTINGGTVTTTGGIYGAGIGGGMNGNGGAMTINGGTVTVTGGTDAAGIGGGRNGADGTVNFGTKFSVLAGDDAASAQPVPQDDYVNDHSARYVHIEPAKSEISSVSAEGWLDLTVGDRIALDEETLVVDPAWGKAETATVKLQNGWNRTYTCASNDLWDTTALTPGRYSLAFRAGAGEATVMYGANFWKTGADWVVFDGSNITENTTFEADKTYLIFGTNTVADSKTLSVTDGAKFEYGAGAGFKGGTVAELPKRYEQKTDGDLYQIVEKIKGCEDNPWEIGDGVEAYTNGTELVIVGKGTITDLSEIEKKVKDGIAAITVNAGVTDAAAGVFYGFGSEDAKVAVTLPDNWQGELPDNHGNWHGAKGELTSMPMAVRQVKVQQRYPWNGKVDVDFDLTGEGNVKVSLSVRVDGKKLKNPTVTGETTFDLGSGKELKDCRITWDAKADFGDTEKHEKIKVKLTVEKAEVE